MSLFICPICGAPLRRVNTSYKCNKNHTFDISKEGYVNLLPVNKKHSKTPGDDKEMAQARNAFLSTGAYAPLRDALCRLALKYAPTSCVMLDCGCGEGYYTAAVYNALKENGHDIRAAGFDISKFILKYAAKREREMEFAVASSYHIPLSDNSCDILINCFSPLALEEFSRILRDGGVFFYVVPARDHLWELKQVLYDEPYENEEKETPYEGFSYEEIVPVRARFTLDNKTDIENLFKMTPYYWKTPKEGAERLRALSSIEITSSFNIHIFKKGDKI